MEKGEGEGDKRKKSPTIPSYQQVEVVDTSQVTS